MWIVDSLKYGSLGAACVCLYLAYRLIRIESERGADNPAIHRLIMLYMLFSVILLAVASWMFIRGARPQSEPPAIDKDTMRLSGVARIPPEAKRNAFLKLPLSEFDLAMAIVQLSGEPVHDHPLVTDESSRSTILTKAEEHRGSVLPRFGALLDVLKLARPTADEFTEPSGKLARLFKPALFHVVDPSLKIELPKIWTVGGAKDEYVFVFHRGAPTAEGGVWVRPDLGGVPAYYGLTIVHKDDVTLTSD